MAEARGPTWAACARQGRPCVRWVERYFKDCLCTARDDASFALGLISLAFWAVAEIPQLHSNFKNKSAHGVSLALLLTWVVGDIFNLAGCLLEPATLPTQLYTALLYTVITLVLVLQTLYYDYYRKWRKCRDLQSVPKEEEEDEDKRKPQSPELPISRPTTPLLATSIKRDMYYTSARSLANSGTPSYGSAPSYLRTTSTGRARSGPPVAALLLGSSSDDEEGDAAFGPPAHGGRRAAALSRSAGYGTFLAAAARLPSQAKAAVEAQAMVYLGRRLLMETAVESSSSNAFGVWSGWIMAAIYMGGRLPQIILNIKRGSVEGLSPLMFLFALMANTTYVGSILVRSVEWTRIKANAPWLLDAIVCVLLDLLIMMQFCYYKFMRQRRRDDEHESFLDYYYVEAEKPQA